MLIHPPLSSVPAVFFVTAAGLEAFGVYPPWSGLKRVSTALFLLGILALPFTYFSGLSAEESLSQTTVQAHQRFLDAHEGLARLSLFAAILPLLSLILAALLKNPRQKKAFRAVFGFCLLLLSALILRTAYLGGELVFERGIGVSKEVLP